VLAVPGTFDAAQTSVVVAAAEGAGLSVVRKVNEATAAVVAADLDDAAAAKQQQLALVFDFGAATTKATVVATDKGLLRIVGSASADVGGRDVDALLVAHFAKQFKKDFGEDILTS
jgi:molecular chaperone DnaK (HSP70)